MVRKILVLAVFMMVVAGCSDAGKQYSDFNDYLLEHELSLNDVIECEVDDDCIIMPSCCPDSCEDIADVTYVNRTYTIDLDCTDVVCEEGEGIETVGACVGGKCMAQAVDEEETTDDEAAEGTEEAEEATDEGTTEDTTEETGEETTE